VVASFLVNTRVPLVLLAVVAGCRRTAPPAPAHVVQLAVGATHACGRDDRGRVRCWGRDSEGALGVADLARIDAYGPGRDVDVGGHVTQLVAGFRTCAILELGKLRCWGSNTSGELGYRHHRAVRNPAAEGDVDVGGPVVEIAFGNNHTCARLEGGDVRCWGLHMPSPFPEGKSPAELPKIDLGAPALSITAGGWEACALLTTGRIRCWGESMTSGETYAKHGAFREIDAGEPLARIALGCDGLCGTTETGRVVSYEVKKSGELVKGPSRGFDAKVQTFVPGIVSCGLLERGRVRCWGNNIVASTDMGLLGVPGLVDQSIDAPAGQDVDLAGPAIGLGSGDYLHCALREDGRVFCWGMVDMGDPVGTDTRVAGAKETPVAYGAVRVFDSDLPAAR